jgi:hypothetical protein
MSIVESGKSKRITRLQGLAGAALVSSAVFVAAPKVARGEIDYSATGNQSWFNTANWTTGGPTATGTLPEQYAAGTQTATNIDPNNATIPSVGVLFDPANDALTPGGPNANYIAQIGSSIENMTLYVSNATSFTNFTMSAPNKLTIESGTLETGLVTDGRDGQNIILQNGGVFINDTKLAIQGFNHTGTIGSGTFEYHGGTYIAGNQIQVATGNTTTTLAGTIGATSAGVGRLVVYNDGPDGAILVTNGMGFNFNTGGKGTIGIVEFHFDMDPGNLNPGVRPVQNNFNTTNGGLKLSNATNESSRLNFVLDTSPGSIGVGTGGSTLINLGLFKDQSISGNGTFPKLFYTLNSGTTAYTQGATVSAAFSGNTYSWTISYSGVITFDNTATSAYTSPDISATGGTDVVLLGVTPIAVTAVPEPASLALLGGAGSLILARRRRDKKA